MTTTQAKGRGCNANAPAGACWVNLNSWAGETNRVVERIEPDEVHITLPTRPPAEQWVEPPDEEGCGKAIRILGSVAKIVDPPDEPVTPQIEDDIVDAVHTIISCHPLQEVELVELLNRLVPGHVVETLAALEASGKVQVVKRLGTRFWCAAEADYAE